MTLKVTENWVGDWCEIHVVCSDSKEIKCVIPDCPLVEEILDGTEVDKTSITLFDADGNVLEQINGFDNIERRYGPEIGESVCEEYMQYIELFIKEMC